MKHFQPEIVSISNRFIVLGGAPPSAHMFPGARFDAGIGSRCAGIIVLGHIEPTELAAVLEAAPDPGIPIADFADTPGIHRDYIGQSFDPQSFSELRRGFAPIWRRIADAPFRARPEQRTELAILRRAYTRQAPVEAAFAPESRRSVEYPLLAPLLATRRHLETLAELHLLRRRHFMRMHSCGKCSSARLNAYEACPGCGSGDLEDQLIVHHYRCGCQEAESSFIQGQLLVCPKCARELRHFGVDYDKPGTVAVCRVCGAANSEPNVCFACLDCGSITLANDAENTDWYHYDLTERGVRALMVGDLLGHDSREPDREQEHRAA